MQSREGQFNSLVTRP
nr:unnamed protein product [Callosobruchus chinensis]